MEWIYLTMATIFEKTASDKCLILEPKESLVYPFDLGDWSEIRVGIFLSSCGLSSNNSSSSSETINDNTSNRNIYFGLCTSGSSQYRVLESGVNFIGTAAAPGSANVSRILFRDSDITNAWGTSLTAFSSISNDYQARKNGSINSIDESDSQSISRFLMSSFSNRTSSSLYASYYGIKYTLINKGQNTQYFNMTSSSQYDITDCSISNLSNYMTTMPNSMSVTGHRWLEPLTNSSTGTPLSLPSIFYFYPPFLNNKIIIHALLIEKYA